jgi:hypothetical protein
MPGTKGRSGGAGRGQGRPRQPARVIAELRRLAAAFEARAPQLRSESLWSEAQLREAEVVARQIAWLFAEEQARRFDAASDAEEIKA